ncbi:hypothetical protein [Nocardioides litoris]|uniref:hypothetical protein n=1 Tax=Nocardioides litoris TaxID=1926648 RepID=UPI00111E7361|nr:hypothetical protein [Nocardioides litoris]
MTANSSAPAPSVSVAIPPSWRRRHDPQLAEHGVVLAARAPALPASGLRPELLLRVGRTDHDDVEAWRTDALGDLADLLVDLAVEDDDVFDLGEHEVVYHRFAHRVGTVDVLCDQWSWLVDGCGTTLTCSAAREDYPAWCDLFETVAATVEPAGLIEA